MLGAHMRALFFLAKFWEHGGLYINPPTINVVANSCDRSRSTFPWTGYRKHKGTWDRFIAPINTAASERFFGWPFLLGMSTTWVYCSQWGRSCCCLFGDEWNIFRSTRKNHSIYGHLRRRIWYPKSLPADAGILRLLSYWRWLHAGIVFWSHCHGHQCSPRWRILDALSCCHNSRRMRTDAADLHAFICWSNSDQFSSGFSRIIPLFIS